MSSYAVPGSQTRAATECVRQVFLVSGEGQRHPGSTITPSFAVPDLSLFLEQASSRAIQPVHPIIDLGGGKRVSTICDPEGNTIRLIQIGGHA